MDKILETDEVLIVAFQNGDREAYNQLVHRYKDKLTNFIYTWLNSFVVGA